MYYLPYAPLTPTFSRSINPFGFYTVLFTRVATNMIYGTVNWKFLITGLCLQDGSAAVEGNGFAPEPTHKILMIRLFSNLDGDVTNSVAPPDNLKRARLFKLRRRPAQFEAAATIDREFEYWHTSTLDKRRLSCNSSIIKRSMLRSCVLLFLYCQLIPFVLFVI